MIKLLVALLTFTTISLGEKVAEVSAEELPDAVDAKHVVMALEKEVPASMVADIKTPHKRSEGLRLALEEVEAEMEREQQLKLEALKDRQIAIAVEKAQEEERLAVAERLAEAERLAQIEVANVKAVKEANAVQESQTEVYVAEEPETVIAETVVPQAPVKEEIVNVDNSGNELLARLVYAEANGEPYIGLVAVAEVILNRVNSDQFPNSIEGVVYDSGQFSPVGNGMINNHPSQQAVNAVDEALNGTNYTGGALFFYNAQTAESRWLDGKPTITQIGRHTFK